MTALGPWTCDPIVAVSAALVVGYAWAYRRTRPAGLVKPGAAMGFGVGVLLWLVATTSPVAVWAPQLFWVRALQVLLLLYAAPFALALGAPLTVLRGAAGSNWVRRIDAALASRLLRAVCSPALTSLAMFAVPWLLYLTPWYLAALTNPTIGASTRILLVVIGFAYYYARLQVDPVPRRYTPLLSMGISVAESLADGVLGLVLWLGPLIAADYYAGLHRTVDIGMRTDQTIGAGILWILGDVLGIPFLLVLMRALGSDERRRATTIDEALDDALDEQDEKAPTGMWWESDPQLRERFTR